MFEDIIEMLLQKKEQLKQEFEAKDAKIEAMLKSCDYVAPATETNEEEAQEEVSNETNGVEVAEEEANNEAIY